jgi:hypothetical protein
MYPTKVGEGCRSLKPQQKKSHQGQLWTEKRNRCAIWTHFTYVKSCRNVPLWHISQSIAIQRISLAAYNQDFLPLCSFGMGIALKESDILKTKERKNHYV